ncbi:hypothetical protein [Streptomyces sp. NRRL F-4489]|uniref:hypothetical protein n=1 Tax=Streptomyces sp. NRRL F-4489 TaxID=1609095 RepID=UPI000A7D0B24|nr:hypothetical protein [Streptomyces sp. NRRL F-4489]
MTNYINRSFTYVIADQVVASGRIKTWETDGRVTFHVYSSAFPDLWPVGGIGVLYQVLFTRRDLIKVAA